MQAEIISVGDEILLGQTINTNAGWMGHQLYEAGVEVRQVTTITDERGHILSELKEATSRVDLVLITGGLGPTQDDITKETLCEFFNTRLVMNEGVLKRIREVFSERGLTLLPENEQQAELPEAADILINTRGTAMGMWFEKNGKVVVSMPGVPHEMEGMMNDLILPRIREQFTDGGTYYTVVQTIGRGESFIAHELRDWEKRIRSEGLSLAYLPSLGVVRLRVSGPKLEQTRIDREAAKIPEILGDIVFTQGERSLADVVSDMLPQSGLKLAVAESCTGGYLAHMVTAIAGSSDFFHGGVVSYSNEMKMELLGVQKDTLESDGAVSEAVVCQMAEGVRKRSGADWALATSGIAGPDGGTPEKPVGTVWIGISNAGGSVGKRFKFGRNRDRNIRMASLFALDVLRRALLAKD